MLNLFDYDFGVRLIKPDPNIYYRTKKRCIIQDEAKYLNRIRTSRYSFHAMHETNDDTLQRKF